MEFKIQRKTNYTGEVICKNYDTTIQYYTHKQMQTLYPNKNFSLLGEIGGTSGVQCGVAENVDGKLLTVYRNASKNTITEKVIGHVAVDDNIYLGVIKNVLFKRILILLITIFAIVGAIISANYY